MSEVNERSRLDEAVEAGWRAACCYEETPEGQSQFMTAREHAAIKRALLAALPVLLGEVVAYETVTPTDDPDVFDAHLWAAAPGMVIPAGAIKLYAPSLGEGGYE